MAKLNFRYGAMNCGKSDTMIGAAYNYTENGHNVVTMMPKFMMRKPGFTTSRAGKEWPIDLITDDETIVYSAYHAHIGRRSIACVLVDEATFMTPGQIEDLWKIAKLDNTSVLAYGIRTNIQGHLFDGAKRLFELADTIEKMPTMCTCGKQAEFNGRFVAETFHVGEPIVMIDNDPGVVRYQSMCADCYIGHLGNPETILV